VNAAGTNGKRIRDNALGDTICGRFVANGTQDGNRDGMGMMSRGSQDIRVDPSFALARAQRHPEGKLK